MTLILQNRVFNDSEIDYIRCRKQTLYILVETKTISEPLFYETEAEFLKDAEKAQKWMKEMKQKIEQNKKEYATRDAILKSLHILQDTCAFYIEKECDGCPLLQDGEACTFELAYPPWLWMIEKEPDPKGPYVQLDDSVI